jgi:hypothetical protein
MKSVPGKRLAAELLDSHNHICDLIHVDYPVLSLYSDGRRNWIYLWCDTNQLERHRWLVFPISRSMLVSYLAKTTTMRAAVDDAKRLMMLETRSLGFDVQGPDSDPARPKRYVWSVTLNDVAEYLPAKDSYFDETLTPDLDLTKQVVPTSYDVPITGTWFSKDFEYLFKRYERLYAFFYATRPRFVRTINAGLEELLRAPWTGGYSRVNLYTRLAQQIPGLHSLRVEKLQFASPGAIKFEAVSSIGESIARTTTLYLQNEELIDDAYKKIRKTLTSGKLNKVDLSGRSDIGQFLDARQIADLTQACLAIAKALQVSEEMDALRAHSPNIVVYSKAVNSFVRQLIKLAELQRDEMLDF